MRILIVEDSSDLASAIGDILSEEGHDVATYEGRSLEGVLDCVVSHPCDVVMLDLGLPFDGALVIEALGLTPDRPAILVCTGADERRVAPLRPRVDAVLRKPFLREELLRVMRRLESQRDEAPSGVRTPYGPSRRRDTA